MSTLYNEVAILKDRLTSTPLEKRALWWCELNCFRWPSDFPISKPDYHDTLTSKEKYEDTFIRTVTREVENTVPLKEQYRAWHTLGYTGIKKTDKEFEAWWRANEQAMFMLRILA